VQVAGTGGRGTERAGSAPTPPVAIVHDHLVQLGGAERVVLELARAFPGAPVHTALYAPEATYPALAALDIRPGPLNAIGGLRRHHRLAFPLMAPAVAARRVHAEVTLCSSAGWAHGARTTGAKVVFWHAPARWLYGPAYLRRSSPGAWAARLLRPVLRRWDAAAARGAALHLANSTVVARRLAEIYGVSAEVVHPPAGLDPDGPEDPVPQLRPGFLLCVSRLLPYKRVEEVLRAADGRWPLVVVGRGPERDRLQARAGPEVRFLEGVSDTRLRWLYRNAALVVSAAVEDYGLVPLEAAGCGTPAVVLADGGFLDTVVDGVTGCFFARPDPDAVRGAVERALGRRWDPEALRAHAARFSAAAFRDRIRSAVRSVAGGGTVPLTR
jgi:glycosyltransferase involved in cell wall biosynthesis